MDKLDKIDLTNAPAGPDEDWEQQMLVAYLERRHLKFTAIPNSTYTPFFKQHKKNAKMGLRKGLPDLLVIIGKKLVFIEMKRVAGGVVRPEQREWIDALNQCGGVTAMVCRGFDEAKKAVDGLLSTA